MIEKIYLIPHTHFDIGFTDQPEEVVRQQLHFLDQALRYCENDPDFRWTIESGMLLREWMQSRPAALQERMLAQLRNGRMEVMALDMQLLTEVASFPELVENVRRSTDLGRKYGFPVETAILDDLGGIAGEMPAAMNHCGIKYLILGTGSCQTEIPWADLPYLFYLRSRSGGRILIWNLGCDRQESSSETQIPYAGYSEGAIYLGYNAFQDFLNMKDLGVPFKFKSPDTGEALNTRQALEFLLERTGRNGYPFGELLMQYGGDNRPPEARLPELVKLLNATGEFPQLILGSPTEFFREMEAKHAGEIPELEGVFTDPWNLRINAVPTALKNARSAQRLDEYLRLAGVHDGDTRENLLLFDDHTLGLHIWGWQKTAANSDAGIRDAAFDEVRRSWRRKHLYAEEAWRRTRELEHRLPLPQVDEDGVAVRNLAAHPVSGQAEVFMGLYARRLLSLTDRNGREIPRQLSRNNTWTIWAENIPALGIGHLTCRLADEYNQTLEEAGRELPEKVTMGDFTLQFPNGALMQISDCHGNNLLTGEFALGEPASELIRDVPEQNENCSLKPCEDRILDKAAQWNAEITTDGELFTEISAKCTLAHGRANVIYRLWKNQARIDVRVRLDQPESPEKRTFYAAFPFAGTGGKHYFDQSAGTVTLEQLLPGAMQDLFLCSRFCALETNHCNMVVCCPDAPVVSFGGMNTARWRKEMPCTAQNNTIFALLANNICNTDAPAWSEILEDFSFSLFLHDGKFNIAEAQKDFESSTALAAALAFTAQYAPLEGLSRNIRMHSDPNGFWLENLTAENAPFEFSFKNAQYKGTLTPFQLKHFTAE